ncbi:MAG: peptidoglycan-binding domain-containing protein [Nitrospirota bacterium]
MNRTAFLAFFVAGAITGFCNNAAGQMMNATVQSTSPRVVASRTAPTTAAKPIPVARPAPQTGLWPTGINPSRFNSNPPHTIAQPPVNVQRNYPPRVQTSNPAFAVLNVPRSGPMQQPITVDPATRQTESRTLAEMRQRRGIVTREGNILDPATRQNEIHPLTAMREHHGLGQGQQANIADATMRETEFRTLETMRERRAFGPNNHTVATIDPQRHLKHRDPGAGPQQDKPDGPKDGHGKKWHNKKDHVSFDDAFRRHWHEWHDRNWWHDNCQTIVFVNTGYYFLDGSYWYPAYGYDPLQTYYDYDGPVYTYSNLLPDEVIANVQTALQGAGYYYGPITGSLSVDTRAAIANFQRDYGLTITGAIDEPTVEALGLDQTDDYYQTDQGY